MADDATRSLQDRLLSDDALRAEFRRDPAAVIEAHGVGLSDEQKAKLHGRVSSMSDDELKASLQSEGLQAHF